MEKRIFAFTLASGGLIGLAACGGEPAPDFAAACTAQGELDTATCACLDEQADELPADVQRFVIATISGDEAAAQELRGDLDDDEALQAGQFISTGVQQCLIDLPETPS
ncbi:MAG: hypothetical protein RLN87_13845 [Parasphingopyxis sp.]|uniref:hypothetical protein n=1 Tax=Parasphingopyxis sp. TaxID=1920299 RepID=UPI0032EE011D